jgi:hypothetical protein
MKAVIYTQVRENYGAHDWDGKGECPQYWKFKGGNTFVVHGVTIEQNMSAEWWSQLQNAVESRSEMFEEYITSDDVVDDIDFDESKYVEEWDAPINLVFAGGRFLATRFTKVDPWKDSSVVGKWEQWVQVNGDREDYKLLYEMKDGRDLTYQEWLAEQEVA